MKYRADIDGLRAVAVLPVLAFHGGLDALSGGFLGVDVFFVISGFLIGAILFREIGAGTFTFRHFYERRVRRILPAYFAVVLACFPLALVLLDATALVSFGKSTIASNLWVANIFFWRETGYFKSAAELQPLLHMWSLSVEEQFYVFFPIVLIVLWRLSKRSIGPMLVVATLLSFAAAEYGARNHASPAFYLLPTRAWELGLGAMAAFWQAPLREHLKTSLHPLCAGVGILSVLTSMLVVDATSLIPGIAALPAVVGTAFILVYSDANRGVGRILATRVLVAVGLVSYSLYLWHQPLFALARVLFVSEPPHVVMAALVLISMGLAYLSWRFVEGPFRSRTTTPTKRVLLFYFLAFAITTAASTGLVVWSEDIRPTSTKSLVNAKANQGLDPACDVAQVARNSDGPAFVPQSTCTTAPEPKAFIWGDSFAMHLVAGLAPIADGLGQATFSGCPPNLILTPYKDKRSHTQQWSRRCQRFNADVFSYLSSTPSIETVVLSSPFRSMAVSDAFDGTRFFSPTDKDRDEAFRKTVQQVEALGKRVVVIGPPPSSGANIGACLRRREAGLPVSSTIHDVDCSFSQAHHENRNRSVRDYLLRAQKLGTTVVELETALCVDGRCRAQVGGVQVYRDSGHVTPQGSKLLFGELGLGRVVFPSAPTTP